MQAVFLKNKTCEIQYPTKQVGNKKQLYGGMNQDIENGHKIWITQYLRISGESFPDFAFMVDEEENVEFIQDQEYSFCIKKMDGKKYFISENFNMHQVGNVKFFYQKDGSMGCVHVRITSMLDDDAYEEIRKDLKAISIRLLYKAREEKANRRIKREYLPEYDLEIRHLEACIKELDRLLKALDQDPMTDMTSRLIRQNFRQVKRLDANIIIDHYVLKKPKVRNRVHEKTLNTYENSKIYSFLKLLEKRLAELEEKIFQEKETEILGFKRSQSELQEKISELKKKLQEIYKLNLFQKEALKIQKVYPLKGSNLFVNHEKYRKVFRVMQSYCELGELLEENLKAEYKSIHKSSELYEVWCYFKILEILTLEKDYRIDGVSWPGKMGKAFSFEEWKNENYRKLIGRIKDYIGKHKDKDSVKSLEELVIHLVNGEKDIYLGYNCTFRANVVKKADAGNNGDVRYSTDRLRPDIFLILNKEIFFTCDAKYKNYKEEFMGIQAWYTDIFECAAYKYIYRLDLGNVIKEKSEDDGKAIDAEQERVRRGVLSVQERFAGAEKLKLILKNGGACILTPAIADCEEPAKYNGHLISEKYETFLKYMNEGKVNRDIMGHEIVDPEEYTLRLKEKIIGKKGSQSDYEYKIASIRFLPQEYRGFQLIFFEALKYEQAHFIEEMW